MPRFQLTDFTFTVMAAALTIVFVNDGKDISAIKYPRPFNTFLRNGVKMIQVSILLR